MIRLLVCGVQKELWNKTTTKVTFVKAQISWDVCVFFASRVICILLSGVG